MAKVLKKIKRDGVVYDIAASNVFDGKLSVYQNDELKGEFNANQKGNTEIRLEDIHDNTISFYQNGKNQGSFNLNQSYDGNIYLEGKPQGTLHFEKRGDYPEEGVEIPEDQYASLDDDGYQTVYVPKVNNSKITFKSYGKEVGSFNINQGSDKEIDLSLAGGGNSGSFRFISDKINSYDEDFDIDMSIEQNAATANDLGLYLAKNLDNGIASIKIENVFYSTMDNIFVGPIKNVSIYSGYVFIGVQPVKIIHSSGFSSVYTPMLLFNADVDWEGKLYNFSLKYIHNPGILTQNYIEAQGANYISPFMPTESWQPATKGYVDGQTTRMNSAWFGSQEEFGRLSRLEDGRIYCIYAY